MTWQDPGGKPPPGPGGPDDESTRSDWDLAGPDEAVGNGGGGPAADQPGSRPVPTGATGPTPAWPAPPSGPPPAPTAPPPLPASGPGGTPGYAPGMAWEPPPTYALPAGPAGGLEYAGVGERFVAWLIDRFILGVIGLMVTLPLSLLILGTMDWTAIFSATRLGVEPVFEGSLLARAVLVSLVGTAIVLAIDLGYFVLGWTSDGRATLGMRALGLQIGNESDGRTLTRGQAAKRWFAFGSWLSLIGVLPIAGALADLVQAGWSLVLLASTASNVRRQGLHDQVAGTAIVRPLGRSSNGLVIGCVVLALLLLVVLPLISIVALIFLGSQVSGILSGVGDSI